MSQVPPERRNRLSDDNGLNSAKLEGCILGAYTKVGAKADLSRCVTQPSYEVAAGGGLLCIFFAMACTYPMTN